MSDSEQPRIIPLRAVDGTALNAPQRTIDELLADSVYQLCMAHMIAGLRVANRLRQEAGQPPLSTVEILQALGVSIEAPVIALSVIVDAILYSHAPIVWDKTIRDAVNQGLQALGRPPV